MFTHRLRIRGVRGINANHVYQFVARHWAKCLTFRGVLVDSEFSIIRGF
jgi:hypothetical protein